MAYVTNALPVAVIPLGSLLGPDRVVLPDVGDDGTVRGPRRGHSYGTAVSGDRGEEEWQDVRVASTAMDSAGM